MLLCQALIWGGSGVLPAAFRLPFFSPLHPLPPGGWSGGGMRWRWRRRPSQLQQNLAALLLENSPASPTAGCAAGCGGPHPLPPFLGGYPTHL